MHSQVAQIQVLADSADAGQCQIPGKVDDLSDCTYKAVHSLNHRHVNPVVRELVRTAFFRYFKVSSMLAVGDEAPPGPPGPPGPVAVGTVMGLE
jgi:hypothetical protein